MDPFLNEEAIFCDALELPPEQRFDFIRQACGDDEQLLDSVKKLLSLHDTEEDFLTTPAIGMVADRIDHQPGDKIGCYELESLIGEGGFGVVWRAKQLQPVNRNVAIKVVKLGMDSGQIVDRFNQERQTLALMNHPSIATVLDAGVTENGRPFFAMELVEGVSIEQYCEDQSLSQRERVKIFAAVCRAVQHAHQKGVVHRDLKPSNILVARIDDDHFPKVIDFGIATAVEDQPSATATPDSNEANRQAVGTPLYMSPEQISCATDIDTRSDIYSLGVVLYRVLTGQTPEVEHQWAPDVEASNRQPTISPLPADLGWIVKRAMQSAPDDRYQSASEFAIDIDRFLDGKPVLAHPGGGFYQIKKFANRNRWAFGLGVAASLALIFGILVSTWGVIHANHQRNIATSQKRVAEINEREAIKQKEIAESEARKLRVIANVLKKMLPEAGPFRDVRSGFQVRENLDSLINSFDSLSSEPKLEADLRVAVARVYVNLSRFGWARLQYSKAREIRKKLQGDDHPLVLSCTTGMAACNVELGPSRGNGSRGYQ